MCGVSGIFRASGLKEIDHKKSSLSLDYLQSRGPDNNQSLKISSDLIFNHSRLSVVDPNPKNNQPLVSISGRYILTYNGEIYNFLDLKKRLLSSKKLNDE